jgi:hypothetical protein
VMRTASASWVAPRSTFSRAAARNRTCFDVTAATPSCSSRDGGTRAVAFPYALARMHRSR